MKFHNTRKIAATASRTVRRLVRDGAGTEADGAGFGVEG
jgi:hypothetical protein